MSHFNKFMPFDLTKAKLERAGIKDIVVLTAKGTYLGKAAYSNEIPGEVQETNKDNKKYFRSAVIGKKYLLPPDVIEKLKHLPASQGWYCITQELLLIDKYRRGEWRGLFSLHSIEELAEIINQCPHFFSLPDGIRTTGHSGSMNLAVLGIKDHIDTK